MQHVLNHKIDIRSYCAGLRRVSEKPMSSTGAGGAGGAGLGAGLAPASAAFCARACRIT